MKLNLFSKALLCAAVLTMASCSDDKIAEDDPQAPQPSSMQEGVYFKVAFDLPGANGSRSTTTAPEDDYSTSSNGVEIGQDKENKIQSVLVVLADAANNRFIASATVNVSNTTATDTYLRPVGSSTTTYEAQAKFTKTDLEAWYSSSPATFNCNIFLFPNPTATLTRLIEGDPNNASDNGAASRRTTWFNDIYKITASSVDEITVDDKFLMSNAVIATKGMPTSLTEWDYYTLQDNPFKLSGENIETGIDNTGNIRLERAAARFDFRDASPLGNFRYNVVYSEAEPEETEGEETEENPAATSDRFPLIDIQLNKMSLVNVNRSFYALRRVSTTGSPVASTTDPINVVRLCYPELPWTKEADGGYINGNYVVDADEANKTNAVDKLMDNTSLGWDYSTALLYPFFTNAGNLDGSNESRWSTSRCSAVVASTATSDKWANATGATGTYKIWKYAVENTFAGLNQINGFSTGVVFKGKMLPSAGAIEKADEDTKALLQAISGANANSETIYEISHNLYLGWEKLRDAAVASAITKIVWVPEDPDDLSNTNGHWEFESAPNRTSELYKAVFGTGGFGTITFTYTYYEVGEDGEPTGNEEKRTGTLTDDLAADPNCANAKYNAWVANESDANRTAYKAAVTGAKITIYEVSQDVNDGWGYYCYYYYWNRHNDNNQAGVMGPMEFAVVRNNVYKLAVTNIKRLGHPRLTENDPDRPYGGTPDEKEDVYMHVRAEVLPWVVRVNNIEF